MPAFLITFKPSSENPDNGWPIEELRRVVSRFEAYGHVTEDWRFANRRKASVGDRVFLLLQGRRGPAIIGYGYVEGSPKKIGDIWQTPVRFQHIVDPESGVLATREELKGIANSSRLWRTQISGVQLPDSVADAIEQLAVGRNTVQNSEASARNPPWTRDELILALNLYMDAGRKWLDEADDRVISLSQDLRLLSGQIETSQRFRNPAGVSMKLGNFLRLDPQYTGKGRVGLQRGGKLEKEIWDQFAVDGKRLAAVAEAIRKTAAIKEADAESDLEPELVEASEGAALTKTHIVRERNRAIVQKRKQKALRETGRLLCEVCGFEFTQRYGSRGDGFIECHHIRPLETLPENHKTRLDDLALVCSNCHRMIHAERPWLSIHELRAILKAT